MRISKKKLKHIMRPKNRANKYGAIRTEVDGIKFASKREAKRYVDLKWMEKSGEIENIQTQPKFPIWINGVIVCNVLLDFAYTIKSGMRTDVRVFEDSKGRDTPVSKLKRKMVEAAYDIEVELV